MTTAHLQFDCMHTYDSGFTLTQRFETSEMVTMLTGPSGSGKSTILSLIAGLIKPHQGQIKLSGRTVLETNSSPSIFIRPEDRRVGLLFQDSQLFPHLTVAKNLQYAIRRSANAANPTPAEFGFDRIIVETRIDDLQNRMPSSLSGGQRQRVSLARTLLTSADFLLLDEPVTAIENRLRSEIAAFIKHFSRSTNTPCLIASHNRDLIDQIAENEISLCSLRN